MTVKVGILAGGMGSRFSEETEFRPKPMIEIGGKPILWHIMMHFDHHGFNEFAIALGYKSDWIKRWVRDLPMLSSHFTVATKSGELSLRDQDCPDWKVDLIYTGADTQTGGRVKQMQPWIGDNTFMLTYGDGVSDVNLTDLLAFHKAHGKLATLTAVRPPARFGHLELSGDQIDEFNEKPQTSEGWINGGFFVLEPQIFDYIEGDHVDFSKEPLQSVARDGQLMAYRHESFWQCMDTQRDKVLLERLWSQHLAPWQTWGRG
jgi:glucose-1-phosphate cytidylyltransferase